MAKDYYAVLGVGKSASQDEIKRAYRKLAQEHHPDKGGGQATKFKEINEAYQVLSDDTKRSQYDKYGQTFDQARAQGASGFGGFSGFTDFSDFAKGFGQNFSQGPYNGFEFDLGDVFSDLFGGGRKKRNEHGVDLEMTLEIDFMESITGVEKTVTIEKRSACPICDGSGAEAGSKVVTCPKCHGQGQIISRERTFMGTFQRAEVCDRCGGSGKSAEKECKECRGLGVKQMSKAVKVKIPAGIEDGQRLKLTGEGEAGYRGSRSGDLYIVVNILPHPRFKRDGYDIYTEVPVSFYQASLGAKVEIDTVDGKVILKIPAGVQSGKVLRLKGKGVPHMDDHGRGDHLVIVRVVTPQKLTRKEKELLRQLAAEKGEAVDVDESLWRKIKDSFE